MEIVGETLAYERRRGGALQDAGATGWAGGAGGTAVTIWKKPFNQTPRKTKRQREMRPVLRGDGQANESWHRDGAATRSRDGCATIGASVSGLELVERQAMRKILGELEFGLSGVVRAKDALRVDVGPNNRQAAFPNQLRSYLTAAYNNSDVTLLERENVEMLLQEILKV